MSDTSSDLQAALETLVDYASDVQHAVDGTGMAATNVIQRYVAYVDCEPIASIAGAVLPPVDFDAWHAAALATRGSSRGSGRLNWPVKELSVYFG